MAQRTTVTILFCDIVGSTALLNQIGEDANDELRRDVFAVLRTPVAALGGHEVKTQGDGMMVAFQGRATDAVACAIAWQQAIDALAQRDPSLRLSIRVGVATGEATAEENDWFGTPVVEAARLEAAAAPGQILVSESVRLVADEAGVEFVPAGRLELKGFPEPRAAYMVPWTSTARASIVPRPPALDTTGAAPFANRVAVRQRIADAIGADARRTVFVAGPAGIGKTRLVAEAVRDLDKVTVLAGSCSGAGRYCGSAEALRWYVVAAPADALRRVLGADAPLLAGLVPAVTVRLADVAAGGVDDPPTETVLEAFVGAFQRVAVEGPVVLVLDDLQLASGPQLALFLELATRTDIDNLTLIGVFRTDDQGGAAPALVTVLDKLDRVADVERIDLGPLSASDVTTVAGAVPVDAAAVQTLTGGNPAQVVDAIRRLAVGDDPTHALSLAFPFKGLVAFRSEDASLFFGRDDAIGTLLGRLAHERFAAVVGTSGSGKSSLVRAGLLPALDAGRLPGDWPRVTCTPGAHPAAALRAALAAPAPRVVFVDQLEECVTQCPDAAERTRFLDQLATIATGRDRDTRVLVTVRADLLGVIAVASPAFAALLEGGAFFLGPMNDAELRSVVEGPAQVAALRLEAGFVDVVVRDVSGEPGALPLLSHALLETWKRRRGTTLTIANYNEAGGARGAIARSADVLFESLDRRGQALTRELFVALTELGEGTEDSRRRLAATEVAALGEPDEVTQLIDDLVTARLITVDEGSIEVAHEALIREWPRLREWLDESRDELRLRREVVRRAEEWNRLGRPEAELFRGARLEQALEARPGGPLEQEYLVAGRELRQREAADTARRVRRLRTALAAALVLLLVAAAAGIVARTQSNRANDRAADARAQTQLADVQRISAESIATSETNLGVAMPLAVEGFRLDNRYETRDALLSVLQSEPALLGYLAAPAPGYDAAAIAPDGKRGAFASAAGIDVWNLATRRLERAVPAKNAVDIAFLGNDRIGVATSAQVEVWDVDGTKPARTIVQPAVSIAPIGNQLAVGGFSGVLVLVDPASGRVVARAKHGTGPVYVAASQNGVLVSAGSISRPGDVPPSGTEVVRHDPRTLAAQGAPLEVNVAVASDLAISPNGTSVGVGSESVSPDIRALDNAQRAFAPSNLEATAVLGEGAHIVFVDENTAITGGTTGQTSTWMTSLATSGTIPSFATQFGTARDLLITPDGSALWAAGTGAAGWSLQNVDSIGGTPTGGSLFPVALSPDGKLLLANADVQHESGRATIPSDPNAPTVGSAVSISRQAHVLDSRTRKEVGLPIEGQGIGFLADGKHVLASIAPPVAGDNNDIAVVDIETGATRTLAAPPSFRLLPVLAPDGTRLAVREIDGTVTVLDPERGAVRAKGLGLAGSGTADLIAFGPGNEVAIQYSTARKIVVIDGKKVQTIDIGPNAGGAIAFSPDGRFLAVGGNDGNVRLYSRATGRVDGSWLVGHTGSVTAVEYDRSGALLASTATDGTTQLFDVAQRRPYGRAFTSTGTARRLFDRDGTRLFNATAAGIVSYSLDPAVWVGRACELAGANMTKLAWSLYLPGRTPVATCAQYPPPQ